MIDDRLSCKALGMLARLRATLRPGDRINARALERPAHREGREAVRAMLRELTAAGYVVTTRGRDDRGQWAAVTRLADPSTPGTGNPHPSTNPQVGPTTGNPPRSTTPNPSPQVTPEAGNPSPATTGTENPPPVDTTKPQVTPETGNPAPENPSISTYRGHLGLQAQEPAQLPARTRERAHAHPRTRGTTPAELNATATRPAAYALVADWHNTLTIPLLDTTRRALAKAVDQLRAQGAQDDLLRTALNDWATRGKTPEFLRYCYEDAARTARAATAHAVAETGARATRPLSKRTRKALDYLAPDDPWRAEFGLPVASPQDALGGSELRVIDGGRSA